MPSEHVSVSILDTGEVIGSRTAEPRSVKDRLDAAEYAAVEEQLAALEQEISLDGVPEVYVEAERHRQLVELINGDAERFDAHEYYYAVRLAAERMVEARGDMPQRAFALYNRYLIEQRQAQVS